MLKRGNMTIITKKNMIAFVDAFIIILIIVDTFLLTLITFYNLDPKTVYSIIYFDLAVCIVLFIEFIYRIRNETDKKRYIRKHWYDIIAMIPIDFISVTFLFPLRLFRLARIIRVVRVLRVFSLVAKSLRLFFDFLEATHLNLSLGILIFTIFSGTIIFYLIEGGVNGKVQNLYDAFWYVMPTIATVGSVDISPVTAAGRLLSIFLIVMGLLLFGMLTASIASWYVELKEKKNRQQTHKELEEMKDLLVKMQKEIVEMKNLLNNNKEK